MISLSFWLITIIFHSVLLQSPHRNHRMCWNTNCVFCVISFRFIHEKNLWFAYYVLRTKIPSIGYRYNLNTYTSNSYVHITCVRVTPLYLYYRMSRLKKSLPYKLIAYNFCHTQCKKCIKYYVTNHFILSHWLSSRFFFFGKDLFFYTTTITTPTKVHTRAKFFTNDV